MSLYFEKKRGLVNGVGTAASSVGALVCAPLLTFLLDYYGLKGTLLLVGGASSHLFIVGMLLRPTEFYRVRWVKHTAKDNEAFELEEKVKEAVFVQYRGRRLSLGTIPSKSGNNAEKLDNSKGEPAKAIEKEMFQGIEDAKDKYVTYQGRRLSIGAAPEVKNGDQSNQDDNTKDTITLPEPPTTKQGCCHVPEKLSFLCQPGYILHVITMGLVYCAASAMSMVLIPTLAKEVGFTQYQGAYLISIHAVGDGVGRLFFGWLMDKRFLPKPCDFRIDTHCERNTDDTLSDDW